MGFIQEARELAKKGISIQLSTATRDAVNGYGWHTVYFLKAFKFVEFCPLCRDRHGVDFKEDGAGHQHKHRREQVQFFDGFFMEEKWLIDAIQNLNDQCS